ncbi:MAG: EscU/YscU/HrcU family type III secretion system export apparatus switch protein, partial [Armatimonadota bacterium]
ARLCLPMVTAAAAVGLAANVLQVGLKVTTKALAPDWSRIDPIKGLARVFCRRSLAELAKSTAKVVVVGWVVYAFLRGEYPKMMDLAGMSPLMIGQAAFELCWRLMARACAAMLIIAAIDYIHQRIQFEYSLRMTKQEVKEEYKRTEGDPIVRSRVRQRQREIARRRMMQDVARSHVVITNPTHLAVALRYDPEEMAAPTVVAKGQRLIAERIKEIARIHGIPLVENPPVAQMLYKTVDVGQQIPEQLYRAVAEILAMVYRRGGLMPADTLAEG